MFLERGCNADFFINILLTILGYIPGIIHALYVVTATLFQPLAQTANSDRLGTLS